MMVIGKDSRIIDEEINCQEGNGTLFLDVFLNSEKPRAIKTFAKGILNPGSSVGFHIHEGESETYYILSGEGVYNDNGKILPIKAGDVTYTKSGEGHGLENTGADVMEFIALIVLD